MYLRFDPYSEHAIGFSKEQFDGAVPAPKGATSTFMPRYVLKDEAAVDRFKGYSDDEARERFDTMLEELRVANEAKAEATRRKKAAVLTPLAYLLLFTAEERIAINSSADLRVRDFIQLVNLAQNIDLTDENTMAGTRYLESIKLLSAGRADQILGVA